MNESLISIGNFAEATRLSLKALRLYDQLGILSARHVDAQNGYRYYHAEQLAPARLIGMLRQINMPLATIRQVITGDAKDAEILLSRYIRSVELQAIQARRAQSLILGLIRQEGVCMSLEVTVRQQADQPILSITKRTFVNELDNVIAHAFHSMERFAADNNLIVRGPAFGIFHGTINADDDGPIEICLPVDQLVEQQGEIVGRILPAGKVAVVTMHGDQCEFPHILAGYDAGSDWIKANGYVVSDSPREIWVNPPGPDALMEIAWPFHEA
ncbi:MerR family transcriptional regulator [Herpetosiphon llansteffanensis]